MRLLTRAAVLAAFLLSPLLVLAQGAIQQSGPVVAGHAPVWFRNGIQGDGGPPGCVYTAMPQSGVAYSKLCETIDPTTGATITLDSNPSNPPLPLNIITDGGPISFTIGGTKYTFPFPSQAANVPFLDATTFGVKADGVTSDDLAVQAAVNACAAAGGQLQFPAGHILLTGTATIKIQNCAFIGMNVSANVFNSLNSAPGTVFYITSQSTRPFTCGSNVTMQGVSFFHPNQDGSTVYPATISDDGVGCVKWNLRDVVFINSYDGIKLSEASGTFDFYNVSMYAAHDTIQLHGTGDGFSFTNFRVSPGPWFTMPGGTAAHAGQMGSTQTVFHIMPSSNGLPTNLDISGMVIVYARTAFKIENGATFAESQVNGVYDSVGTIVDTSSGGNMTFGIPFSGGDAGCQIPNIVFGQPNTGNAPCFDLGDTGVLTLNGFMGAGSNGDFIRTAGASVIMTNSENLSVGSAADGGQYYNIHVTANHPVLTIIGNEFGGRNLDNRVHGITADTAPSNVNITGNTFAFLDDAVNFPVGVLGPAVISSNHSSNSAGTDPSMFLGGGGNFQVVGNFWDHKSSQASVASCGTGATVGGSIQGIIHVGSGGPVTSCDLTLGWTPYGDGGGMCMFSSTNIVVGGVNPTGTPPTWHLVLTGDLGSAIIWFVCPGEQ